MTIILYTIHSVSPPARAVDIVIKILGLDVERRDVNIWTKENHEPWFLELNPTRQLPVLNDNGYILTDSHAIIAYLLTVYGSKDMIEKYYPTDAKERATVDSRLHFENGVLFARIKTIFLPLLLTPEKEVPLENTRWLVEGVNFLEKILEGKKWLAGDRVTVADISTITTIDVIEWVVPLKYYKNVSAWAKRAREIIPFYNESGIPELQAYGEEFKKSGKYDSEDRWNQIQNDKNE